MIRSVATAVVLAASLSVAAPAKARSIIKENATHDNQHLDIVGLLGFWGWGVHVGAGAWYAYPVAPEGFLPNVNDAFFIEAGGAFEYVTTGVGICDVSYWALTPLGGARWSFYLTEEWSVFGTAKLGVRIGFGDSYSCGGVVSNAVNFSATGFTGNGSVGAHWQFSDAWAARFELGYLGLTAGAGFDL